VYDGDSSLSHKSGLTDFRDWYRKSFGRHTPWGEEDSEALVTAVESALERTLSAQLMQGAHRSQIKKFPAGTILFKQGDGGTKVLLVLDGVVRVERDGERLAEYGPGAILGERAHLEGGIRTSTNVAVTPCRVAMIEAEAFEHSHLEELSAGHRREDHARD
jgi:CRP-like cAMP-binding protein